MKILSAAWNLIQEVVDTTLALRNSTTAQILNVYNTYTSDTVYERGFMRFVSNVMEVGAEHVGASLRSLRLIGNTIILRSGGGDRVTISSTLMFPSTDAGLGLGNASFRWLSGFFSTYIRITPVAVGSLVAAATAGTGAKAMVNDALTPVFGSTVAAGGAVTVPVYCDGTNWKVG